LGKLRGAQKVVSRIESNSILQSSGSGREPFELTIENLRKIEEERSGEHQNQGMKTVTLCKGQRNEGRVDPLGNRGRAALGGETEDLEKKKDEPSRWEK